MSHSLPDFAYISSILHYDPTTGILTWKPRPREQFADANVWRMRNTRFAGKEAGTVGRCQRTFYRNVSIDGRNYKTHRLAYLLHHGVWPEGDIDHIDGDGLNNRAINLRDVAHQENLRNQRMYLNNTSGTNGVSWYKRHRKWRAQVKSNGQLRHIGYFDTLEEATAARLAANDRHGFTERHGVDETLDAALAPLWG